MRRIRTVSALTLTGVSSNVVFGGPTAAQDGAYEAALESGDLSSLIPEQFADAEMMSGMSFERVLGPSQIDTPDGAAAREELLAITGAAGLALADAVMITGFTGSDQTDRLVQCHAHPTDRGWRLVRVVLSDLHVPQLR